MKSLSLLLTVLMLTLGLTQTAQAGVTPEPHVVYNELLTKHVDQRGMVNYDELKKSEKMLDVVVAWMSGVTKQEFDGWSKDKQLAFLTDVYNAYTLKLILKNHPVVSITKLKPEWKIWDQKIWTLFGNKVSLNEIEHEMIRPWYLEPRIHFTVVCAAISCPPLQDYSYFHQVATGKDIGEAMDEPTREFLANPGSFKIDRNNKTVHISKLLEWYGDDFKEKFTPKSGYAGSEKQKAVLHFFAGYLSEEDAAYLKKGGYQIKWMEYDWNLNKQ